MASFRRYLLAVIFSPFDKFRTEVESLNQRIMQKRMYIGRIKVEIKEIAGDSAELSILEAINEEAIPEIQRCALRDMLATGAKVWSIHVD